MLRAFEHAFQRLVSMSTAEHANAQILLSMSTAEHANAQILLSLSTAEHDTLEFPLSLSTLSMLSAHAQCSEHAHAQTFQTLGKAPLLRP